MMDMNFHDNERIVTQGEVKDLDINEPQYVFVNVRKLKLLERLLEDCHNYYRNIEKDSLKASKEIKKLIEQGINYRDE